VAATTREMPKKYWRNLPEAAPIPDLVAGAARRADEMIAPPPGMPPPFHDRLAMRRERLTDLDVPARSVEELRHAAAGAATVRCGATRPRRCSARGRRRPS